MAGVAKVCYCDDLGREGLWKGLVGGVAVEFSEVEGSEGRISFKGTGWEMNLLYSLKSPL